MSEKKRTSSGNWLNSHQLTRQLIVRMEATRGLLATDHVILNNGQVTWTTPELAPPSPNYHTTGPKITKSLQKIIEKFKETGSFNVKPGKRRKPILVLVVKNVVIVLQEQTNSGTGTSSA
ncbi:hypothetical protein TNCV_276501 [Trichonephila clavipes]|nr:hypothetical protein TNCV_276501 [Trichonephila clavipes]